MSPVEDIQIISNTDVAKVTLHSVEDRPGIAADFFSTLGTQGFNIELVTSVPVSKGKANISFVVAKEELPSVLAAIEPLKRDAKAERISYDSRIALVSVYGHELIRQPGVAGRMFKSLSSAGINIEMISTSMSSITCIISEESIYDAVKALEREFEIKPFK